MGTSPEQLRADIEETRARLTEDLDRLAERVSPRQVVRRAGDNPLAIGLVAFGAGLLTAAAIPETANERRAAARLTGRAAEYAGRYVRRPGTRPGTRLRKGLRKGLSKGPGKSAPRMVQLGQLKERAARTAGHTARGVRGRGRVSRMLSRG
jgi:hypothetical protein